MISVSTTGVYEQCLATLVEASPELEPAIDRVVRRFKNNPSDTRLDVHELRKRLAGRCAITVTRDIRIIFRWIGKRHALFLTIGPHETVYPGYRKTPASKLNDA